MITISPANVMKHKILDDPKIKHCNLTMTTPGVIIGHRARNFTSHDLHDPTSPWPLVVGPRGCGVDLSQAPALNLEDIHTPEEELISFSEMRRIFSDTGHVT